MLFGGNNVKDNLSSFRQPSSGQVLNPGFFILTQECFYTCPILKIKLARGLKTNQEVLRSSFVFVSYSLFI